MGDLNENKKQLHPNHIELNFIILYLRLCYKDVSQEQRYSIFLENLYLSHIYSVSFLCPYISLYLLYLFLQCVLSLPSQITSCPVELFFPYFFIMKGDFWGFLYYPSLSYCITCGGVGHVTLINVEIIVESSGSFKKLPQMNSCVLEFFIGSSADI